MFVIKVFLIFNFGKSNLKILDEKAWKFCLEFTDYENNRYSCSKSHNISFSVSGGDKPDFEKLNLNVVQRVFLSLTKPAPVISIASAPTSTSAPAIYIPTTSISENTPTSKLTLNWDVVFKTVKKPWEERRWKCRIPHVNRDGNWVPICLRIGVLQI